jgi:hypothetical protein
LYAVATRYATGCQLNEAFRPKSKLLAAVKRNMPEKKNGGNHKPLACSKMKIKRMQVN